MRNIIYESECSKCNQPGERKENDKNGLEERRGIASLYVGESARSVHERALEHWRDAESGKEETHMVEHQAEAHRGEDIPQFRFRVVKKCKSSLERQVREAVRIQMRGNVLNKKGVYYRCKLTRLVIDSEWDDQTWKESWEPTEMEDVNEECIGESSKAKRKDPGRGEKCKRRKVETEAGVVWGEGISSAGEERSTFLSSESTPMTERAGRQSTIKLLSGVEWLSRLILR